MIFFALTEARPGKPSERQPLDAVPDARGSVMAYRGVAHWHARTVSEPRPAAPSAEGLFDLTELAAAPAAELEPAPLHPLAKRFMPHGQSCSARKRGAQASLFDDAGEADEVDLAGAVPAARSPLIYNVKAGVHHAMPVERSNVTSLAGRRRPA